MTGTPASAPQANTKKISAVEAVDGIYFDFEGRIDEEPVLLGVLYRNRVDDPSEWIIRQLVLDPVLQRVDEAVGNANEIAGTRAAITGLVEMADDRKRPLISWSSHDWRIAKEFTDDRPFRYRNALSTVKRWRHQQRDLQMIDDSEREKNHLHVYERWIGYDRPEEHFDVGTSIDYIRQLKSVTDGADARWSCILQHNRHDLIAMRNVVLSLHGIVLPSGAPERRNQP